MAQEAVSDRAASPQPGPELVPLRYWVTPDSPEPGVGQFWTDRDRALMAAYLLIVPLLLFLSMLAGVEARLRWFMVAGIVFTLVLFGVIALAARRRSGPPGGVWTVDADGWPVRFVGERPPRHLRRDRGLTRDAYVASIRALPQDQTGGVE